MPKKSYKSPFSLHLRRWYLVHVIEVQLITGAHHFYHFQLHWSPWFCASGLEPWLKTGHLVGGSPFFFRRVESMSCKNIPADCFPRVSLHDLKKKHLLWTTEKRANSHVFVTLQFQKFSKLCAIPMGRKKMAVKHCYLQGIVTCPYCLGPQNGDRFLRRFSFRCGIGYIFVALFVKSSFGTFLLWSCTSQGMRHFQTSIAIDDNTSWSQHWGVLRFCCWHYIP